MKVIPIQQRSKEEIAAFHEGFEAGIKMSLEAITTNAEAFRQLVANSGGESKCIKTRKVMRIRHPEKR